MGRRGKKPNKSVSTGKKKGDSKPRRVESFGEDHMDDEIDAFHKQQDMIPLDVDGGADLSDEDIEQPVFDLGVDDDDDEDNDSELSGLAAKIMRQKKYLREKMGGVEDEMEEDEADEEKDAGWGQSKRLYYSADNIHEVHSSDDESAMEEEAEVIKLQRERAKSLQMEDFGLDEDEQEMDVMGSPSEPKTSSVQRKKSKQQVDVVEVAEDGTEIYKVEKDISSLSKEEQMEVVLSAAPELVGLISELNYALDELGGELGPPYSKANGEDDKTNGGMHYLEVKHLLLLNYCQAIVFYLLLKSEGHPIRQHPVLARLVEIKNLLDKVNQTCPTISHDTVETLGNDGGNDQQDKIDKIFSSMEGEDKERNTENSDNLAKSCKTIQITDENLVVDSTKPSDISNEPEKIGSLGQESLEMLKIRASLEEKLMQKGIYDSVMPERMSKVKAPRPSRRKHETLDDFDDEDALRNVPTSRTSDNHMVKLSQLVTVVGKAVKRPKLISGDADLPMREDIGERRRKHDLQSLGKPQQDWVEDVQDYRSASNFEDEFYKEVKQSRAAKIASKAEIYNRNTTIQSSPEQEANGKRQITYQMETNKGLTRKRKKLTKIPRKKYKMKHQKAVVHRKGQVRDLRRPSGPYGGEEAGISTRVSHSVRFRN